MADGELWDEAYRIFQALQILGATLVNVFFMVNFFKETTDIKHGMTMEASIQSFIKLALVDAVFLNLTNILVSLIEIEQAFFGIIVPEDAASLVISVGDRLGNEWIPDLFWKSVWPRVFVYLPGWRSSYIMDGL